MDIKKRRFIFIEAGFLTVFVFIFALFVNDFLDGKRVQEIDKKLLTSTIKEESFLTYMAFEEGFNVSDCEYIKNEILTQFLELKEVGVDIKNYGSLFLESNENMSKVKQRDYFLSQFDMYVYTLEYNEACEEKLFPVIYFFNGQSTSIDRQSIILEQFSLNNKNKTIVVSYDYFFEGEVILNALKERYNVTYSPFLILNNKTSNNLPKNIQGEVSLNTITLEFLRFRGEI